jgi:hypothetical protein
MKSDVNYRNHISKFIEKYNAKLHPDVRSGKKHEEEVLVEFLDTFEQHHSLLTGDKSAREGNVTWDEFFEYYNNVSCSIDDDRFFELMIRNSWNMDGNSYQKGSKFEY